MVQPKNPSRRTFLRHSATGASLLALGAAGTARGFAANERVRLGWVGVGARAQALLTDVRDHCPEARSVAVCDLVQDRVERAQKVMERDKPAGYTDFRRMLDEEKLDGVLVVTEPCNHASVVVPVLEAGIHCFAEKPMDITVEAIDAITLAARKARETSGALYQIGTQRRYNPGYVSAMEEIHNGLIGKITFMQGQWHWPWKVGHRPVAKDGGRFIEQASHHTDVMAWVMKDVAPLTCVSMGYSQEDRPEGPNVYSETHSATSFLFPGGIIFSYTHLFHLPRWFQQEKVWVFGEDGGVDLVQGMYHRYENPHVPPPPEDERPEARKRIGEASGADWNKGTREQLEDFVANIKSGGHRVPTANVESGRICSLMCVMARMAMVNEEKNVYEPRLVQWKDLGSTA